MQKHSQHPHFFTQKRFLMPQKITARWQSKTFSFYRPAKTSRDTLLSRESFFLMLSDDEGHTGVGEAAPIPGLSREWQKNTPDQRKKWCQKLDEMAEKINNIQQNPHFSQQSSQHFSQQSLEKSLQQSLWEIHASLQDWPSLSMALEMAWLDLCGGGKRILFPSAFSRGETPIVINGLVWMAEAQNILTQIQNLLTRGFDCIKMKIDRHNINDVVTILSTIRKEHPHITLRLDANGCFDSAHTALKSIEKLSHLNIHSIEQPLPARFGEKFEESAGKFEENPRKNGENAGKFGENPRKIGGNEGKIEENAGKFEENTGKMEENERKFEESLEKSAREWNNLIKESPIKLAFDEELIHTEPKNRKKLLEKIAIPYLVLKPSLLGGFGACEEWINLAKTFSRQWWITSALESNVGLNALAQWTHTVVDKNQQLHTPQGLGTGELFSNNFSAPIQIKKNKLFHTKKNWDLSSLDFSSPSSSP